MRITCDPAKRERTLKDRGVDMLRAKEIFAGLNLTRVDDRFDYGEPRFIKRRVARFAVSSICLDTTWRSSPRN